MNTYEKIRTSDGRCLRLKNPREIDFLGTPCLHGVEVDREGNSTLDRPGGSGTIPTERQHLIQLDLIKWRRPMLMSNYYGELVYMNGKP